jgi:hypothetical protein
MKKEKKTEIFPWKKVFVIAVGVLFVAMMVLSAMGMSWLQSFRTVMANDSVTIDFTLRDATGQPVLTTDQNLYQTALARGYLVFITSPLTIRAGYIGNPPYTGVQAENYYVSRSSDQVKFGVLGQELDELDAAVLGMKTGDIKTIHFMFSDPLTLSMSKQEFTSMGGNFTNAELGDLIPIGISQAPIVEGLDEFNSTPTNAVLRIATVVNKTADGIEVQHRYPSADITVKEFK